MQDLDFEEVAFEEAGPPDDQFDGYVATQALLIPLDLARRFADPLENPPWDGITCNGMRDPAWCTGRILEIADTRAHAETACQVANAFAPDPVRHHMERIAWLMNHPAEDEITILATAGYKEWALSDGNHRLAAAILSERPQILARFVGLPADIEEIFRAEGLPAPVFEEVEMFTDSDFLMIPGGGEPGPEM